MWTTTFWKDALERALKTALQVFIVTYGAESTNITDMFVTDSLTTTLSLAGATAILSVAMSMVSSGIGDSDSASVVNKSDKQ